MRHLAVEIASFPSFFLFSLSMQQCSFPSLKYLSIVAAQRLQSVCSSEEGLVAGRRSVRSPEVRHSYGIHSSPSFSTDGDIHWDLQGLLQQYHPSNEACGIV